MSKQDFKSAGTEVSTAYKLKPNLENGIYAGALVSMAGVFAATGSVTKTILTAIVCGSGMVGESMIADINSSNNARMSFRPMMVGLALISSALTTPFWQAHCENKLASANPVTAMINAGELGPKTVVTEFSPSSYVGIQTAQGKRDTITYVADGLTSQKSCTTYWLKENNAVPENRKDEAQYKAIDFNSEPYKKVGDCTLVEAYRTAQAHRGGQISAAQNQPN